MRTVKRILVPIDFGESSLAALELAITLASKFDSAITLLNASWVPPIAYASYGEALAWPVDEMADGEEKELRALLQTTKARWPKTESLIVRGDPWQVILETAATSKADLIVMGTHGRRGVARLFMGSVAERIVRMSAVPVLTVSGKAERDAKAVALQAERAATAPRG